MRVRSSHWIRALKKVFLKISQNSPVPESFCRPQVFNFLKKEVLTQVFSFEFCEIFKNTFFTEHLRVIDSGKEN